MADFAKDVSTYSAAASSRRRPAGGGRCARAALGGGHYCRYVLSQLSKPPLGQWVIPFRWLRDIDGDDPEDILILALYARLPQYGMDRFCTRSCRAGRHRLALKYASGSHHCESVRHVSVWGRLLPPSFTTPGKSPAHKHPPNEVRQRSAENLLESCVFCSLTQAGTKSASRMADNRSTWPYPARPSPPAS
jgi:hypothetical protein